MRRRLVVVVAVVAVLSALMAAPATAKTPRHGHRPFGGEQMMVLNAANLESDLGFYGCEEISWFGTIVLYGKTFGMALYPIDLYIDDDGLFHYEEGWKIFTKRFKLRDGVLKNCHPGRVLAAGTDVGEWDGVTGLFESIGDVEYASRRFRGWYGRTVHQDGVIEPVSFFGLEDVVGFYGTLWLS